MSSWLPDGFLSAIPKTDLHVHLDGSLRLNTLIELAKKDSIVLPSYEETELRKTVFREHYANLVEYLEGFQYTVAVMRSAENLERIAFEFAEDNFRENVRYFEVRFAPQLVASVGTKDGLNIQQVLRAVNAGLHRAKVTFNRDRQTRIDALEDVRAEGPYYDYGIIVCAMRTFPPCEYFDAFVSIHENCNQERVSSMASETLILASVKCRDEDSIPIVALDVAGAEDGYPNKTHKHAFHLATINFFAKTVHAGEASGPDSIFQAVQELHAERIGHGFHLFSHELLPDHVAEKEKFVQKLVKYICDRRICLEVCLTSNLGTMPGLQLEKHAIRKMIDHSVSITICTDNRLVSNTTMVDEITKAVEFYHLTPKQLRDIVITGFKRSFFHGEYAVKRRYVRSVMDFYDRLAEENNVAGRYEAFLATQGKESKAAWSLGSPTSKGKGLSSELDSRASATFDSYDN